MSADARGGTSSTHGADPGKARQRASAPGTGLIDRQLRLTPSQPVKREVVRTARAHASSSRVTPRTGGRGTVVRRDRGRAGQAVDPERKE